MIGGYLCPLSVDLVLTTYFNSHDSNSNINIYSSIQDYLQVDFQLRECFT